MKNRQKSPKDSSKKPSKKSSSFRLDKEIKDKLNELSEKKNKTISTLGNEILQKYLTLYRRSEVNGDISIPKTIVTLLYNSISKDEDDLEEIINITTELGIAKIDDKKEPVTGNDVLTIMQTWFQISHLELKKDSQADGIIRLWCRHNLGKKWSDAILESITRIFKNYHIPHIRESKSSSISFSLYLSPNSFSNTEHSN